MSNCAPKLSGSYQSQYLLDPTIIYNEYNDYNMFYYEINMPIRFNYVFYMTINNYG